MDDAVGIPGQGAQVGKIGPLQDVETHIGVDFGKGDKLFYTEFRRCSRCRGTGKEMNVECSVCGGIGYTLRFLLDSCALTPMWA